MQEQLRRAAVKAAAVLLLAAPLAAATATYGGQSLMTQGPGRISVKKAGLPPLVIEANYRFVFEGAADATSGAGSILAYDALGKDVVAELPIAWTAGRGASCTLDLASPELEAYVAGLVQGVSGGPVSVAVETAGGRGTLRTGDDPFRASLRVGGTATIGEGEPRRLAVKLRLR